MANIKINVPDNSNLEDKLKGSYVECFEFRNAIDVVMTSSGDSDLTVWLNGSEYQSRKQLITSKYGKYITFEMKYDDMAAPSFTKENVGWYGINSIAGRGSYKAGNRVYQNSVGYGVQDVEHGVQGYNFAWFFPAYWDDLAWRVKLRIKNHDSAIGNRMTGCYINSDGNVVVQLSHSVLPSGSNRTGGNSLPEIYRKDDGSNTVTGLTGWSYVLPFVNGARYDARPRYSFDWKAAKVDKDAGFSATSGGSEDEVLTIVDADFYNDIIYTDFRNLAKPTGLKRSGKRLSWTATPDATSYTVYKNGTAYKTTSNTYIDIDDGDYYGLTNSYTVAANDRCWVSFEYIPYTGHMNGYTTTIYNWVDEWVHAYKHSDKASSTTWNNVGYLYAPSTSITKNSLNNYTIKIPANTSNKITVTTKLRITVGAVQNTYTITNGEYTIPNMIVATKYTLAAWFEGGGITSSTTTKTITPVKAPTPVFTTSGTGWTSKRKRANAFQIEFTTSNNDTYSTGNVVDKWEIALNGVYKDNGAAGILSGHILAGFKCNQSNKITIKSVFNADHSYDSTATYELPASFTPKLTTPALTETEIASTTVQEFWQTDFGNQEINEKPIVDRLQLDWSQIEFADGYVMYDEERDWDPDNEDWKITLKTTPNQTDNQDGTEISDSRQEIIYASENPGYHKYWVKAVFKDDEDYNSEISNIIEKEQNIILEAPLAEYDPNTTTVKFTKSSFADFYSVQLTPHGGTVSNLFRSFTLDLNQKDLTYNFYDMIKDLRETELFDISVIARSYNAFHYRPSNPSNICGSVQVIKLKTPDLAEKDAMDITGLLKWEGDDNTFKYHVYIKAIDGEWANYYTSDRTYNEDWTTRVKSPWQYQFYDLAGSLYSFYVIAERDDSLTNETIPDVYNPSIRAVYLDSDKSAVRSAGILSQPQNFQRFVNRFSWDDVGDDVQKYVLWDAYENEEPKSIVTVDGGGVSLELGMVDGAKHRPREGYHRYQIQAVADIGGMTYYSALEPWSSLDDPHIIDCQVKYLNAPVASYNPDGTSDFIWTEPDKDVGDIVRYDTRVNNEAEADDQYNNTYSLRKGEPGRYYFTVREISDEDEFLFQTSLFSNQLLYEVFQLPRPEITLTINKDTQSDKYGEHLIEWEDVPNATDYEVHIKHIATVKQDDGNIIQLDPVDYIRQCHGQSKYSLFPTMEFGVGNFEIYVTSIGSIEENANPKYIESEKSNTVKFGTLATPSIKITDNEISWEPIYLADYYEVINYGDYFSSSDDNRFELDVSREYSYSIQIGAKSTDPNISPSTLSNTIRYDVVKLGVPKFMHLEGTKLKWDVVNNADYYTIWANDEQVGNTSNNEYEMTPIFEELAGVVRLYVRAHSNKINYLDSDESNYVLKAIAKEAKYNIVIDGHTYNQIQLPFKMNETLDESLDTASMTLAYLDKKEPFEKLTPVTLLIYESEQDSRRYRYVIESDTVEEVQYKDTVKYKHVLNLIEPTILLQNEIVPNFTVTKDNIRKLVSHIKVDPDYGGNVIAAQDWAEDDSYVATGDYFRINFLELIEFIGDVLKFALPDAGDNVIETILNAIRTIFSYIPEDFYETAFGRLNIMGIGTSILGTLKNEYKAGQSISLPTPSGRLNGYCYNMNFTEAIMTDVTNSDSIIGSPSANGQALGHVIQDAADWVDSRWGVFGDVLSTGMEWIGKGVVYVTNPLTAVSDLFNELMGVDGCTVMDDDWAFPARVYKYRPHSDSYANTGNEIELARTEHSSTLITTTGKITKPGVYDIILEIPPVDFQDLADRGLVDMNPVLGRSNEFAKPVGIVGGDLVNNINAGLTKLAKNSTLRKKVVDLIHKILLVVQPVTTIIGWSITESAIDLFLDNVFGKDSFIEKIANCRWPKNVNFMKNANGYGDWYDYERNTCLYRVVWKNITITNGEEDDSKTISWVLKKVMSLTNNKYTMDPVILKLTEGYRCPDLTFSGSNNLYEILTKLGREFYGIPRLTDERVITFDVLDETCPANRHQKIWRDHNVLMTRQQELNKSATGFIAPISNMILDDDITVYPAPGMWTHARGPEDKAVIDIGEQIITLDKPIYKIEQVLVKNVLKDSPDTVLDITDFVYQDIVYNSLNAAEWGKGRALRWTQGEKTIDGLGQIPEESKLYAALGWKADDYVIQHIIKGLAINDDENWKTFLKDNPNEYLYQITYQGYIDTLSYIENSNKTNQSYQMYKVFNQMDNTVSDKRFGDAALIQLKRHGNDIIEKSYITDSVIGMPLLGDYVYVDDDKYYIDEVTYEFENSYIRSHVKFSKNYNKINPRVGINSEYRQYRLRVDQNVDRTINFNEYCYVGDMNYTSISNIKSWKDILINSMNKNTTLKPDTFYFNCYDNIALDRLSYRTRRDDGGIITERVDGIALPCNMAKIGASIQFSAKMLDSFCAGNSIYEIKEDKNDRRMAQKYVRYVGDDAGNQVPRMRVTIGSLPNSLKTENATWSYPSVYWYSQPQVSLNGPIVLSKEIEPLKDQREALNFNYQMHFISNRKDLFIHKGMTKYLFRNILEEKKNVVPVLVAHNSNLSMKDTITVYDTIGSVSIKSDGSRCRLTCSSNSKATKNYTGLAVIWPDTKEILFEIVRDVKSGSYFLKKNTTEDIYFNFTDTMKYKIFE